MLSLSSLKRDLADLARRLACARRTAQLDVPGTAWVSASKSTGTPSAGSACPVRSTPNNRRLSRPLPQPTLAEAMRLAIACAPTPRSAASTLCRASCPMTISRAAIAAGHSSSATTRTTLDVHAARLRPALKRHALHPRALGCRLPRRHQLVLCAEDRHPGQAGRPERRHQAPYLPQAVRPIRFELFTSPSSRRRRSSKLSETGRAI